MVLDFAFLCSIYTLCETNIQAPSKCSRDMIFLLIKAACKEVAHERGAEGRVIASFIGVFCEHTIEGGIENEAEQSGGWENGKMGRREELPQEIEESGERSPRFMTSNVDVKGDSLSQESFSLTKGLIG